MDTIFLITDNPSDFESSDSILGFTLTLDEAVNFVNVETERYKKASVIINELEVLREEFISSLEEIITENVLDVPKWKDGLSEKDITQEMRNERTKILLKNEKIRKNNQNKFNEGSEIIKNYLSKEYEKMSIDDEIKKYIEIDFLRYRLTEHYKEPFFIVEPIEKIK